MDKAISKIERKLAELNSELPDLLGDVVKDIKHLQLEIKRYKRNNFTIRSRNFSIVLALVAVGALVIGEQSYYYAGAIVFFFGIVLLSPSASYARNLANAKQKLFLMTLLNEMDTVPSTTEVPSIESNDFLIG